jgi:hypothetical protein
VVPAVQVHDQQVLARVRRVHGRQVPAVPARAVSQVEVAQAGEAAVLDLQAVLLPVALVLRVELQQAVADSPVAERVAVLRRVPLASPADVRRVVANQSGQSAKSSTTWRHRH